VASAPPRAMGIVLESIQKRRRRPLPCERFSTLFSLLSLCMLSCFPWLMRRRLPDAVVAVGHRLATLQEARLREGPRHDARQHSTTPTATRWQHSPTCRGRYSTTTATPWRIREHRRLRTASCSTSPRPRPSHDNLAVATSWAAGG